uniref:Uncharacterized protein n=1 Tax=Salix viminalis TaxID=40686 RepID=A0A6N2JZ86_SALVM
MKKSPVPPTTERSLVVFAISSAPAMFIAPFSRVELKTKEKPNQAEKKSFLSYSIPQMKDV